MTEFRLVQGTHATHGLGAMSTAPMNAFALGRYSMVQAYLAPKLETNCESAIDGDSGPSRSCLSTRRHTTSLRQARNTEVADSVEVA